MSFNWENEEYTGLSCPICGSPNIEIDSSNTWFCYDCDHENFQPFEEE